MYQTQFKDLENCYSYSTGYLVWMFFLSFIQELLDETLAHVIEEIRMGGHNSFL